MTKSQSNLNTVLHICVKCKQGYSSNRNNEYIFTVQVERVYMNVCVTLKIYNILKRLTT